MKIVNVHKAKTTLSSLIEDVLKGEEVIIARNGEPVVSITKLKKKGKRIGGQFKGKVKMSKDFNVLPEEFLQHFE